MCAVAAPVGCGNRLLPGPGTDVGQRFQNTERPLADNVPVPSPPARIRCPRPKVPGIAGSGGQKKDEEGKRPPPLAIRACARFEQRVLSDLWLSATGAVVNGGRRPPSEKRAGTNFVP